MPPMDEQFVPYVISWNLTQRCNLRCQHCYIDASTAAAGELGTEEVLRVLDEIAAVNPETMLILTGGEPLCRPDLEQIVERAATRGMTVVLGTNGTLLSRERARALAERGLSAVGISLDSLLPERHDAFRVFEGAWRGACAGIEAARDAGLEVQVQTTLTRENVEELPRIVDFTRDVGGRVLSVFFLVCTGRGQGLVDLSPEEYEVALHSLARQKGNGVMVRPRCAPTFRRIVAQEEPESILLQSDAGRCLAAKHYCRITPEGEVTPCPYMPLGAGSLKQASFGEIWRSARLFQDLRAPKLQGTCGECEYAEVCGGCRARAYALSGDPLAEDPWCTYEPGTDAPPERNEPAPLRWTAEAEERIRRVPFFVRKVVRSAVEAFARRRGLAEITPELLDESRRTMARPGGPFGRAKRGAPSGGRGA